MLATGPTLSAEEQKRQKELARLQGKLDKALDKVSEVANKKDCTDFLNGIFQYASQNFAGSYGTAYANVNAIVQLAQNANYQIVIKGDTTVTPNGISAWDMLKPGSTNNAFVERGQNVVYLGPGAFGGNANNLAVTLLHEALHISYSENEQFVGLGLSDMELAQAAGVFKQGMTNDQASKAFSNAMREKCK
jgi:hypothetical protein